MVAVRTLKRAVILVLLGAGAAVWYACSDRAADPLTGPALNLPGPDLRVAIAAQERHSDDLLEIPGVVGTAVGVLPDGRAGVQILLERSGVGGLPASIDGVPVTLQVTGRFMAFSDPTQRQRPAPLGFSVGHPDITAGTIGARVRDAIGRVYILSNNHVLANVNDATIGDPAYQPGPFDGGTAADQIATLTAFQPITFGSTANNTMDAAIALSSTDHLDNATPEDAYGMPNANIYGDANADGMFDDRNALLGLHVQKFGRTTRHTHGQITGVNATVNICYEVIGFACTLSARFVDQLIITPGGFSGGGDSGSLIVTDDENKNPVALLFAGSATQTIANRIDLVLNRFGVTIDGFSPGPLTDVAVTTLGVLPSVVVDSTTGVTVTVTNLGNQDVSSSFDVTLQDSTANVTIGTQSVAGLAAGASTTLTFSWTPGTNGDHVLIGSHTLTDDRPANNQKSATVAVNPPFTDVAVTSVTGPVSARQGQAINVAVTVRNAGNLNVGSFVVTLQDVTDNVTLGTQTVTGLAVGATSQLTFSWNTSSASIARHILLATHSVTDDNAANNERSVAVTIDPKPTDIALTSFTGPSSVTQGDPANFSVTIRNSGEQDVNTSFDVVLTNATAGVTIGTQTVTGLAIGATSTLSFSWNTTGVAISGHTLIARQMLADDDSTNNARAIGITVNPPVNLVTDVSVAAMSAPGSVTQGNTTNVTVTVQNVGEQNVGTSFNVVLTDATAGVTIGTQTVAGLGIGATSTLSFPWNTTGAALGSHTLVATHSLSDGNTTNNQRSATVTVTPKITDIALTSFTGPSSVTQGNTANFAVTIQNVGQQDVGSSFNVVLTDASAGVTIGTQAVAGLAMGGSSTLTFPWNTTGAAISGHTLIARQMLPDDNATNNSRAMGVTVTPPVTGVTDIAVTSLTAPASVRQGQAVNVTVTVGNVGNQHVGTSFAVTLQDATAGVTIGTQTVATLNAGATSTLNFSWNTSSASLGGHTLVATHNLTDNNAANNQRSATVTVTPRTTDVGVITLTAPSSLTQGTTANIGVTVRNLGELDVGTSFNVVLTDVTAGVTIGTQTVAGLAVGFSSAFNFSWNTASAALGGHTLVATHSLTDDNAGNNQRSTIVTVNRKTIDIALTNFTGPTSVSQGATANFAVTIQNVGQLDVGTAFNVVLTDASAGVTIGTQSVASLAIGATSTLTFPWNTTGASISGHTLFARQMLPDDNPTNNARAMGVTVTPPTMHMGNLGGLGIAGEGTWAATVEVTVHDVNHGAVNGAVVRGTWSPAGTNANECTTDAAGTCTVLYPSLSQSTNTASFAVNSVTRSGTTYQPSANHDVDGGSNGTTIMVSRP